MELNQALQTISSVTHQELQNENHEPVQERNEFQCWLAQTTLK